MISPLAAFAAVVALATPSTFVIHGDASIGGIRLARTTPPQAARLFASAGRGRSVRRSGSCRVTWQRIGLTVDFGVLGTDPTDPCVGGTPFTVTITSRDAWRTDRGLRVGDSAGRLRKLYPGASLHGRSGWHSYWLVTRHTCELGGYTPYPAVRATIRAGRVTSFVAAAGICE